MRREQKQTELSCFVRLLYCCVNGRRVFEGYCLSRLIEAHVLGGNAELSQPVGKLALVFKNGPLTSGALDSVVCLLDADQMQMLSFVLFEFLWKVGRGRERE